MNDPAPIRTTQQQHAFLDLYDGSRACRSYPQWTALGHHVHATIYRGQTYILLLAHTFEADFLDLYNLPSNRFPVIIHREPVSFNATKAHRFLLSQRQRLPELLLEIAL